MLIAVNSGEETRIKIAAALSKQTHILLADEPTCHLDQEGINLLIGQLKVFSRALLIIRHDRYLPDEVVDKIWELKDSKITEYWGGYSEYLQQRNDELQQPAEKHDRLIQERKRLEFAVQEKCKKARQLENKQKGTKAAKNNESKGRLGRQKTTGG